MSIVKSALIKASGNRLIQNLLERNAQVSQYLMGIGSGGDTSSSGEEAMFRVLKRRRRPPYCIFDVGANKGQFLRLALANLATDDLNVHCFEPGRETFKALVESSPPNDKQIKLNNIGLGREKGEALLHYDDSGSGLASLTKRRLEHFNINFDKSERVFVDTIDNYCSGSSIDHIHLLKIDIEGHELDALAGAKKMFAAKAIDVVTFEFGGCNIDTRTFFRDFWYFFKEADFALFRIAPSGYLHPLESYRETYEQFRATNFMAVANG